MNVGPTIRRIRRRRKLSQSELARLARIGRVTLARIEAGTQRPTVATLKGLAKALGVPLTEVLK